MASVISWKNGSRAISFYRGKKRETIYLGQIDKRRANAVAGHVEELLAAKLAGATVKPVTAAWLKDVDGELHDKLAKAELVEPRKPVVEKRILTLESFIDGYLAGRTDIKHWTRSNCQQAKRNLVNYFGADRDIRAITQGDADEWHRWLRRDKPSRPNEPFPPGLAQNTARRHCGRAKQFFKVAIRKKLIVENPFADLVCRVRGSDDERLHFVTRAEADKVLAACHSHQWRLVFALARFGGLRCPSEHSELRVREVDLADGQMKVRSPKTEHLPGGAYRMVPIFPDLRPYLEAAIAELPQGAEYVITLPGVVRSRGNNKASNLGTEMARIIKRAGLQQWPKLFQNCRASCEIELAAKYGVADACQWIGNTIAVAQEHYLWATQHRLIETENRCASAKAHLNPQLAVQPDEPEKIEDWKERLQECVEKALQNGNLEQLLETVGKSAKTTLVPRVGLEPTTY